MPNRVQYSHRLCISPEHAQEIKPFPMDGRNKGAPPSSIALKAYAACVKDRSDTPCLKDYELVLTAFAARRVEVSHTGGVRLRYRNSPQGETSRSDVTQILSLLWFTVTHIHSELHRISDRQFSIFAQTD